METFLERRVSLFVNYLQKAYLEEQNMEAVLAGIHSDITWIGPWEGNIACGQDRVAEVLRNKLKDFKRTIEITEWECQAKEISRKNTAFCGKLHCLGNGMEKVCRFQYSGLCIEQNGEIYLYQFHISEIAVKEKLSGEVRLKKACYDELLEMTRRDSLTGLYNKKTAEELAEGCITGACVNNYCAVMILDLDDFKNINDTYGHMAGDHILEEIGKILKSTFRKDDVVGRIGGDEFIIIMPGFRSESQIIELLGRLMAVLETSFLECVTGISCSAGIAMAPLEGTTFSQLYRKADKALYQAKAKGKKQYCFHLAMPEKI